MRGINKLSQKWGVKPVQFWLIMLTFALGGSLSGRLCSKILEMAFLEKNWAFWLIYPLLLTILWPFSVLFVSFFTGQFSFFKGYLGRVGAKLMGGLNTSAGSPSITDAIHVALFASGAGSNARKIIEYFEDPQNGQGPKSEIKGRIKVSLIVCNVPTAGVLQIAKEKGIPTLLINKAEFNRTGYVESLRNADINFIVLAGFLWKIPEVLVNAFQPGTHNAKGIINIHPALLPKYGGKGMYGAHVHEAVIAAKENESGITIHWVDAHYDEGDIIFQATCKIDATDTPDTLANKIHALEHAHFAPTIERLLSK
jgi:folate-dependent phosphoribosylglycinamide formyltransferase PurN